MFITVTRCSCSSQWKASGIKCATPSLILIYYPWLTSSHPSGQGGGRVYGPGPGVRWSLNRDWGEGRAEDAGWSEDRVVNRKGSDLLKDGVGLMHTLCKEWKATLILWSGACCYTCHKRLDTNVLRLEESCQTSALRCPGSSNGRLQPRGTCLPGRPRTPAELHLLDRNRGCVVGGAWRVMGLLRRVWMSVLGTTNSLFFNS